MDFVLAKDAPTVNVGATGLSIQPDWLVLNTKSLAAVPHKTRENRQWGKQEPGLDLLALLPEVNVDSLPNIALDGLIRVRDISTAYAESVFGSG